MAETPEPAQPNTTPACFIFGAGPFYGLDVPPAPGDLILAADGGYRHCCTVGLQPHLLLGDFDSLDVPPPQDIPRQVFPPEKDDTDTMLAVKLGLERGFRRFHLYGGTGGRLDHTLASLQTLAYLACAGARGELHDEGFVFTAIQGPDSLQLPPRADGLFSVFCLGADAKGVSIQGGKYETQDITLTAAFPLGVSNQFQGKPVVVSVTSGCLLVGWER